MRIITMLDNGVLIFVMSLENLEFKFDDHKKQLNKTVDDTTLIGA